MERLVEHVIGLPAGELPYVTIQDMAICTSWYETLTPDSAEHKQYAGIRSRLEQWMTSAKQDPARTMARRNQWVLRELIGRLERGEVAELNREELDVLHQTYCLARRTQSRRIFDRVDRLIGPHFVDVDDLRKELPPAPGMPALASRFHIIGAGDIKQAKRRVIERFAGVGLRSIGPVLTLDGHVRVLDSIPDHCTLVVENGSCSIDGYLLGKVAATGDCEVRENIGGVVVVRQGDVRAANIVDRATVISKQGSVYCCDIQGPDLVFAGEQIQVEQRVVAARCFSPKIGVRGNVVGGELHVSDWVYAERFSPDDNRPLTIVLRREITSDDYGEAPEREAVRLVSAAYRLRRRINETTELIRCAEREIDHCAGAAILYLTGGESRREIIDHLRDNELRLAVLDRTIAELNALSLVAEQELQASGQEQGEEGRRLPVEAVLETMPSIAQLTKEFSRLYQSETLPPEFQADLRAMSKLRTCLVSDKSRRETIINLLSRLRQRLSDRTDERDEIISQIEKAEEPVKALLESQAAQEPEGKTPTKVAVLKKLLNAAKGRPLKDPVVARLQNSATRVVLRTLNARMEQAKMHGQTLAELQGEFEAVTGQLKDEYNTTVEPPGREGLRRARAIGCFESGVKIYGDAFIIDEQEPPQGTVIETRGRADKRKVFTRDLRGVVEQKKN